MEYEELATRGEREECLIGCTASSDSYELGSVVTVTLDLSAVAQFHSVAFVESIPKGWTVVQPGLGLVSEDGTRLWFELSGGNIPSSLTYTLKAPETWVEPEYRLAAASATLLADDCQLYDLKQAEVVLRSAKEYRTLTVHTSGRMGQWRVNGGEWLASGISVSVERGTEAVLEMGLPEGEYVFDQWTLYSGKTVTRKNDAVVSFTMPNDAVVAQARFCGQVKLPLQMGWNLLCKTSEMADAEVLTKCPSVFTLEESSYVQCDFQELPLGRSFWVFLSEATTLELRPEASPCQYQYRPAESVLG